MTEHLLEATDTGVAEALGIRRHRTAVAAVEHAAALQVAGLGCECVVLPGDSGYLVGPGDMGGRQLLFARGC